MLLENLFSKHPGFSALQQHFYFIYKKEGMEMNRGIHDNEFYVVIKKARVVRKPIILGRNYEGHSFKTKSIES